MMASPAASAGEPAVPVGVDPWDWSVQDVTTALCSPDGLLRQLHPVIYPDPVSLVRVIQDQCMSGLVLLRCASDVVFLEQKMGLAAAGHRIAVLDAVTELQDQSAKFSNYQIRQASRVARSIYGPASVYGENRSPMYPQSNGAAYSMMPPLSRWLNEPIQSPHTRTTQGLEIKSLDDVEHEAASSRPLISASSGNALFAQPHQSIEAKDQNKSENTQPMQENDSKVPQSMDIVEIQSSKEFTEAQSLKDDSIIVEMPDREVDRLLRAGESYVIDSTGKKRRKLTLAPVPPAVADGRLDVSGPLTDTENAMTGNDASPQTLVDQSFTNATSSFAHNLSSPQPTVSVQAEVVAPTVEVNSEKSVFPPLVEIQEPGTIVIDAQGRKRMRPMLVVSEITQDDLDESTATAIPSDENPERNSPSALIQTAVQKFALESDAKAKATEQIASKTYLGRSALPVDHIFYGSTAMDHEVDYTDETGTVVPFEGVVDQARASGAAIVQSGNPENWFLSSNGVISSGQRLYVSNRLRFSLSHAEWQEIPRGSDKFFGVVPYPARIAKMHQRLSMTVMSDATSAFRTVRANRLSWFTKDNKVRHPAQKPREGLPSPGAVDIFPDDSVLAHLGENEPHDWDYLEKWTYQAEDEVLPLYGDSGSEGELDLDTWREIEDEEKEKKRPELERPLGISRNKHLTHQEVEDIIEAASSEIADKWKKRKLPSLEAKAWQLWVKSRRDNTNRAQVTDLATKVASLEHRLSKIKRELLGEVWSKVAQVKKQCQCLERSIWDRECNKWKIGILQLKSPPPRAQQTDKSLAVRVRKRSPESLEEGEEDLGSDESGPESADDGLDDFIIEDEMEGDDVPASTDHTPKGVVTSDVDDGMNNDMLNSIEDEDETDDEILSPSRRRDRNIRQAADLETSPDAEQMVQQKNEPLEPVNLLDGEDDLPLSSPLMLGQDAATSEQSLRHPKSPKVVNQMTSLPDIIDLTQLSDPPETPSPQPKLERLEFQTPFQKERDPFDRDRRAPSTFKAPPTPAKFGDMESDISTFNDDLFIKPEKRAHPSSTPTKEKVPELQDIDSISRLESALLIERKDRKRLLTWIVAHTSSADRKNTLATISGQSAEVEYEVWNALKAIKGHAHKTRRAHSDSFMRLASWYVSWHMCKVYKEDRGFPMKDVQSAIDSGNDMERFHEFYNFIVERLDTIEIYNIGKEDRAKEKEMAERKNTLSSSPLRSQTRGKKRQKRLDDGLDTAGENSTHKKRKYAVQESQEGVEMRNRAHERAQERVRRQETLRRQMSSMGVVLGGAVTMIVNGKTVDEMIAVNPEIANRIQPHQMEGVQFMWGEIVADDQERQGCLLAHTMGLGKTMQVITLLVTIAEAANHPSEIIRQQIPETLRESRTLVLCPPSLVNNWSDELMMWRPSTVNIGEIRKISASLNPKERVYEIQEWAEHGGVLLVGYNMFKDLILNTSRKSKSGSTRTLDDEEHRTVCFNLLELPNIIVADEAHALKQQKTAVSVAVQKLKSKRRIALTGSPLANNLEEYYSIINWIAPNYLGSRPEFRDKYVEPIRDGLFADATQYQKRKGLQRLQVLKAELDPKVHRADVSILTGRLKGKTEFVLRVPLTTLQYDAYKLYVEHVLSASGSNEPGSATLWAWLAILRLLCNHPSCFRNRLLQDEQDVKAGKKIAKAKPKKADKSIEDPEGLEEDVEELLEGSFASLGLSRALVGEVLARFAAETTPLDSTSLSYKMQLLVEILRLSKAAGDKVLVFSHSIATLDYIENLLIQTRCAYQRLDGKTKMQDRQQLTKDFNSKSIQVCLISTKAGGQGLNLFGANRVVIMDDTFNPMYEEQAIGRAYRIGQQKHVYVYRLTVGGTFEQALQDQSLLKIQLATRVVDKKNPMRHALKGARQYLFLPKDVEQKDLHEFLGKDTTVLDKIMGGDATDSIIRSIDLTETFHQEVDEPLTAEEEIEAKQMVSDEKLRRTDPAAYEQIRFRRAAQVVQLQAQTLNPPSHANQVPILRPKPSTQTPAYTSNLTNREWEERYSRQQKRIAEQRLGYSASSPRVQPQGASAVTPSMPGQPHSTVGVAGAMNPPTAPSVGARTSIVHDQTLRISSSMDAAVEAYTKAKEPTPSNIEALIQTQGSSNIPDEVPTYVTSERGSPFPSVSSRASIEPMNASLVELTLEKREDLKRAYVPRLKNVIEEEVAGGKLIVPNVLEVANVLSYSMERHAYKNAADLHDYHSTLEATVRGLRNPDKNLPEIVAQAQQRLARKHKPHRSVTKLLPDSEARPNEPPALDMVEGNRQATSVPGSEAESVGVTVPSPLPKPFTFSSYDALTQLFNRETNRKSG